MSRINLEYFLARRIAFTRGGRKNNVMVRIATLSVAVGMAVMIVSLAVIFGFKHEITAKLTGFGSHVCCLLYTSCGICVAKITKFTKNV